VGGTPFRCLTLSVSFSHVPCCSAIVCTHGPLTALLPSVHIGTSNLYILAATVQRNDCSTLLNSAAANTTSATQDGPHMHSCGDQAEAVYHWQDTDNACYYRLGCVTPRTFPLLNEKPETRKKNDTRPKAETNPQPHKNAVANQPRTTQERQQGQRARAAAVSMTHLNKERTPDANVTAGLCIYCRHCTPMVQSTLHYTGGAHLRCQWRVSVALS
jgi:hypothetical protein